MTWVLTGGLAVLIGSGLPAAYAFPLQAPTAEPSSITVQTEGALLHRAPIEYPREAIRNRISGVVVLEVSINSTGEVSDARVVSGHPILRRAALQSVLQWHYDKDNTPAGPFGVTIGFQTDGSPAISPPAVSLPPPPLPDFGILRRIRFSGLPEPLQARIQRSLTVREGDLITREVAEQVRQALRDVDEHVIVVFGRVDDGAELVVALSGAAVRPVGTSGQGPPRIRVASNVQGAQLLESQPPVYPPLAKQARIQGLVRLNATIGKDGRVLHLEVVSGHPLLIPAAIEAVRQWVYRPTLLNGDPVEVITQVDVNFALP